MDSQWRLNPILVKFYLMHFQSISTQQQALPLLGNLADGESDLKVEPVILEGKRLRLEPLAESHIIGIAEVIRPEFFKYFGGVTLKSRDPQDLEIYFRARMTGTNTVSFAIISKESEKIVGHSSYMSIREPDRVLEIGATWIGVEYRGTYVNPEAKFLMMRHAFETLGCVRVELKTDERNLLSQNAMTKLGLCQIV